MKPHKHAAIMKAYAERAQVSETPWDIIQVMDGNYLWTNLTRTPEFSDYQIFRIKPRTININGFEVPEPVSDPLNPEQYYYYVDISLCKSVGKNIWWGDDFDSRNLKNGIIHLTKEAAELHAKALLSFTEK